MDQKTTRKRKFLNYIHNFRGLAILFIVGIHTVISFEWTNPITKKAVMTVTNNGTVLFVFIAGFLFYYLGSVKFHYSIYLKKKVLNVILPYVIISIPAIIDKLFFDPGNHWWMNEQFNHLTSMGKIAYMIGTGKHSGALWFIPMISLLYLLSPIFIKFGKSDLSNYMTPILCIGSLFTFRFGYHANIYLSLLHFFPIYLFGMWIAKNRQILFNSYKYIFWALVVVIVLMNFMEILEIIPFNYYMELRDNNAYVFALNLSKLKAMLLCVVLIIFFHIHEHKKYPALKILGDYSFGIFFLHIYLINAFQILGQKGFFFESLNLAKYLIYTIVLVILNMIIIYIAKFILGKNSRMFIGS